MDLYCPKCGEPWDNDSIHERATELGGTYLACARDFRARGCEALGTSHGQLSTAKDKTWGITPQEAAAAMYDLLGDDMDGAAAMMDDLGF